MIHEVVNDSDQTRGRPRTTWTTMENHLKENGSRSKEVMPWNLTRTDVSGSHALSTDKKSYSHLEIGENVTNHRNL